MENFIELPVLINAGHDKLFPSKRVVRAGAIISFHELPLSLGLSKLGIPRAEQQSYDLTNLPEQIVYMQLPDAKLVTTMAYNDLKGLVSVLPS